jgi:hypothetical protein
MRETGGLASWPYLTPILGRAERCSMSSINWRATSSLTWRTTARARGVPTCSCGALSGARS